jgi:hypothetical protein
MRGRLRYFFNLAGAVYDPDDEGLELRTVAAARHQAVLACAEFIHDKPDLVWTGDEVRMEVTDSRRTLLFTVVIFGVDSPAIRKAG